MPGNVDSERDSVAKLLRRITGDGLESTAGDLGLGGGGYETTTDVKNALSGLDRVIKGQEAALTPAELRGLEAIILPRLRPVTLIRGNRFGDLLEPWTHLNTEALRDSFAPRLAAIGRIEVPNDPRVPYGGTGFLVADDLVMTNRHVARLFADGLGLGPLRYQRGDAAIDFSVEQGPGSAASPVPVREVVMIHPWWDMALLRIEARPAGVTPLRLVSRAPASLNGCEVVVVGYPARDDRGDVQLQDRIFDYKFNVKRFQPGALRELIRRAGVPVLTHDCSTLGGNSGSAVLELRTGEVLALHFAGDQFVANYSVAMWSLASDPRVRDLGLVFAGELPPPDPEVARAWATLAGERPVAPPAPSQPAAPGAQATWIVPLQISVSIGQVGAPMVSTPALAPAPPPAPTPVDDLVADEGGSFKVPKIYPNLGTRRGYRPDFLTDPDDKGDEFVVPLPILTKEGLAATAPLLAAPAARELKYHKFSIVMHAERRLALFTAANVDWRPEMRTIDGVKYTREQLTEIPKGTAERWVIDRRISEDHQLPDIFFTEDRQSFDKGHLVRRDDVAWGRSFSDMQKSNGDTYHTTNCSPQTGDFNTSNGVDNWGALEQMIQKETKAETVCLFSGPLFAANNPWFNGRGDTGPISVKIPRKFWKILVTRGDDRPEAYGFILSQDLSAVDMTGEEFVLSKDWKQYLRPIAEIEQQMGDLVDLSWFKRHDRYTAEKG